MKSRIYIILSLYINASISGYEYYPVTLGLFSALRDSLFAPLATARCSDAGSFTRSEPSHPRTTPHVSTNRNHMREARGWMRVRSLPNPRVRGRKTSLRWARHASPGKRAKSTGDQVCDRADGLLDVKYASLWEKGAGARARALSGARAPPLSRVRRFNASRWQVIRVHYSDITRIGPRTSRM